MGAFFSYTLQAAVVMAMIYLAYKWLMSRCTFHAVNRVSLLVAIAFSWALPALMPLFRPKPMVDVEFGIAIPLTTAGAAAADASRSIAFTWPQALIAVYCIGAFVAAVVTAVGIFRMSRLIRRGIASPYGRYTLVVSDDAPGPFSWGRYIVIRPEDLDGYQKMVIAHEEAHLDRLHWVDLIIAQLNAILQWFNPAAWLIMHEMKNVHEYQADAAVGGDAPHDYQIMLLKKTVGASFPTFADSLNHSQIKQRLTMMMKSKTRAWRRISALAIPAATVAAAFALSIPAVADVLESISRTDILGADSGKITKSPSNGQIRRAGISDSASEISSEAVSAVSEAANQPQEEGESAMATDENASQQKGFSPAYFVNGRLFTGSLDEIDSSRIKSMSVVKNDPVYPQGKIMIEMLAPGEEVPAAAAEKMADFKGGQSAMIDFLKENLRFPEDVKISKTERVIVQFVVGTDGSVSDSKILKGASREALDDEALRVVGLMDGHWEPAIENGRPVATHFTLPVQFSPNAPKSE